MLACIQTEGYDDRMNMTRCRRVNPSKRPPGWHELSPYMVRCYYPSIDHDTEQPFYDIQFSEYKEGGHCVWTGPYTFFDLRPEWASSDMFMWSVNKLTHGYNDAHLSANCFPFGGDPTKTPLPMRALPDDVEEDRGREPLVAWIRRRAKQELCHGEPRPAEVFGQQCAVGSDRGDDGSSDPPPRDDQPLTINADTQISPMVAAQPLSFCSTATSTVCGGGSVRDVGSRHRDPDTLAEALLRPMEPLPTAILEAHNRYSACDSARLLVVWRSDEFCALCALFNSLRGLPIVYDVAARMKINVGPSVDHLADFADVINDRHNIDEFAVKKQGLLTILVRDHSVNFEAPKTFRAGVDDQNDGLLDFIIERACTERFVIAVRADHIIGVAGGFFLESSPRFPLALAATRENYEKMVEIAGYSPKIVSAYRVDVVKANPTKWEKRHRRFHDDYSRKRAAVEELAAGARF